MPYASKRKSQLLNYAYAHLSSPEFASAAKSLQDTLVDKLGFERFEADYSVVNGRVAESLTDQIDLFDKYQKVRSG
jgi:type III restriction enzyme